LEVVVDFLAGKLEAEKEELEWEVIELVGKGFGRETAELELAGKELGVEIVGVVAVLREGSG
jgi:hypothetical protein